MTQSSTDPLKVIQDKIDIVTSATEENNKWLMVHWNMWFPYWPAIGFILYQYFICYLTGVEWIGIMGDGLTFVFGIAILAPHAPYLDPLDAKNTRDILVFILYGFTLTGVFFCSLVYPLIYTKYSKWVHTIYLGTFLLQLSIAGSVICYRWFQDRMLKKELERLIQEKEECLVWINFLRENTEKK